MPNTADGTTCRERALLTPEPGRPQARGYLTRKGGRPSNDGLPSLRGAREAPRVDSPAGRRATGTEPNSPPKLALCRPSRRVTAGYRHHPPRTVGDCVAGGSILQDQESLKSHNDKFLLDIIFTIMHILLILALVFNIFKNLLNGSMYL